jgi:oxidase EvaA
MQAKIEPGNINLVQLSPTLQATRSNYTRTHKGKTPLYFEYFNGEIKNEILIDQLQSEQGARFLKKRNRNIIIEIDKNVEVELFDGYKWMTLGLINTLMNHDNLINMDTRTVISSVFQYLHTIGKVQIPEQKTNQSDKEKTLRDINKEESLFSTSEIISWITALKFHYELEIESKPIADLDSWVYDGNTIYHNEHKYFSVIGIDVKIGNREVKSWDQPMIKPAQEGIIGFIIRKINGVYHFLVQAKVEAGNFDILELAPTVQCLTGNYRTGVNEYSVPFICQHPHLSTAHK